MNRELGTLDGASSIRFGMVITYGTAVVGNLSSDSCIDYTALGEVVNLAARMEELTKSEVISQIVASDGVLLSENAKAALPESLALTAKRVDLDTIKIRSFESIGHVWYLRANPGFPA